MISSLRYAISMRLVAKMKNVDTNLQSHIIEIREGFDMNMVALRTYQNADEDFHKAKRRAFWNKVFDAIRFQANDMPALGDLLERRRLGNLRDGGMQTIPVHKIIGSVNRERDFDRNFMPRRSHIQDRWARVDEAYQYGVILPPLDLVEVDGAYFVRDGHHRVSVARAHGMAYLDAHVTVISLN
jgi:hypothetical protein